MVVKNARYHVRAYVVRALRKYALRGDDTDSPEEGTQNSNPTPRIVDPFSLMPAYMTMLQRNLSVTVHMES